MEKYAKYLKEKYNRKVLESKHGFITYEMYSDRSCLIDILWVSKEKRGTGEGRKLEKSLIDKEKPKVIFCEVDKYSKEWELALTILVKGGYSIYEEYDHKFVLFRNIDE